MTTWKDPLLRGEDLLTAYNNTCFRKVARSGHVSYGGRPYYISKRLAGTYIKLNAQTDRLIIETAIPLRKEYAIGKR